MSNFKNIFKELRISMGYTQEDLAKALGISRSAVSMYENGNREPDFETLDKISSLFQVNVGFLLGCSNPDTPLPQSKTEYDKIYQDLYTLTIRYGKYFSIEQKHGLIKAILKE